MSAKKLTSRRDNKGNSTSKQMKERERERKRTANFLLPQTLSTTLMLYTVIAANRHSVEFV